MKKIITYSIIVIMILVIGLSLWINYVPKEDRNCQTDDDCIAYGLKCGSCPDNNIAINKDKLDKYSNRYHFKCFLFGTRYCDSLPRGTSQCLNNSCTLKPYASIGPLEQSQVCRYLDDNFKQACSNSDCVVDRDEVKTVWRVSYRCPGPENFPLGQTYFLEVNKQSGAIDIIGLSN